VTSDGEKDRFFVLAGWLIDGGGGPVRRNVFMDITKGNIISMIETGTPIHDRHNLLDLSHCTIIPGLIDSHVHLAMSGTEDQEIRRNQLDASFEDTRSVVSLHLKEHARHGVVAVRDGGDHAGHILRYIKDYPAHGESPVITRIAGRAWHTPGRYGRVIGRFPEHGKGLAQSILRDHKGINHIKIVQSGLNSLTHFGMESSPQFDHEELREAVRVGERLGLGVMVHANGRYPVRSAIEAGCSSIEHGFFMGDENLDMMAEKRIVWVPTVFTMEACSRIFRHGSIEYDTAGRNLKHQLRQISRAMGYGVLVAAGTDSGSPGVHHGLALIEEIRLFISAGLSLVTAIRCATSNGARLLGLEGEAGTLKPGMPATFVATKGGPEGLPKTLEFPEAVYVRGKGNGGGKN